MSTVKFINGNIFDNKCEAIVCPVNCFATLGAGIAKAFRDNKKFKGSNEAYYLACKKGELAPGSVYLGVNDLDPLDGSYVFYLATKFMWTEDSKMESVENGLINLTKALNHYKINSCAIPLIGSGLGHLPAPVVELTIKEVFETDDNKERIIEVYRYGK